MSEEIDLGEVNYMGYCKASGGMSLASGQPLPPWAGQDERIREAWRHGAHNVAAEVVNPQAEDYDRAAEILSGEPGGDASDWRNLKKLVIAWDALREVRDRCAGSGQGLAAEAHRIADEAIARMNAIGPSLEEILGALPGDGSPADIGSPEDGDYDDCEPAL